jgi:hypothetical protein
MELYFNWNRAGGLTRKASAEKYGQQNESLHIRSKIFRLQMSLGNRPTGWNRTYIMLLILKDKFMHLRAACGKFIPLDMKMSHRCLWRGLPSGIWPRTVRWKSPDIWEEYVISLLAASPWFLIQLILLPSRLRRHVPPKRRLTSNKLHDYISQKTELLI